MRSLAWRLETRCRLGHFRLRWQRRVDLGEPGDGAASVTHRGSACHAGEARAKAAIASRMAARAQSWAAGQADAIAILMRRTLTRTIAPILSSLRRIVPQVALAKSVSCSPIRRNAQSST